MKKILSLILALSLLTVMFTGCSGNSDNSTNSGGNTNSSNTNASDDSSDDKIKVGWTKQTSTEYYTEFEKYVQSSIEEEFGAENVEFLGWFDGEATVGQAGAEYTVTKDITLTAHWQSSGDDAGEDEPNIWFLVGAIVCGILAIVCLAIGPNTNWYSVIGTVVFAIAAVVCGLLYAGVI